MEEAIQYRFEATDFTPTDRWGAVGWFYCCLFLQLLLHAVVLLRFCVLFAFTRLFWCSFCFFTYSEKV